MVITGASHVPNRGSSPRGGIINNRVLCWHKLASRAVHHVVYMRCQFDTFAKSQGSGPVHQASVTVPGSSGHWRRFRAFVLNHKSRKQTPFGRTLTDSKDFGSFGKPRGGSFQQRHKMGNRLRVLKSYGHLCESLYTSVSEGWRPEVQECHKVSDNARCPATHT